MKNILLVALLPLALWSTTLKDIIKGIDNSLLLKSKDKQIEASRKMIDIAKSKDYPKIDISLDAIKLKETPTTLFVFPPYPPTTIPLGTKDNITLKISFVYPIFTGYAIKNSITKSKLELIRANLQKRNLQRELYLKAATLYGSIYMTKYALKASKNALDSIDKSLKKAQELYKNELLNDSALSNIEAKKYQIIAKIEYLKNQISELSNNLYYISGIKNLENLKLDKIKNVHNIQKCIDNAMKRRSDIKELKERLKISQYDIKIAKSRYYPTVSVVGAIKKQGDNFKLNGNGYTNADSSYLGIDVKWNIFDGKSKKARIEALRYKKEATFSYFEDYKKRVKTDIINAFLKLKSLKYMLKASKKELQYQKRYHNLTKGRFENDLASADELSRSISSLSLAQAKVKEMEAKIFIQNIKILLMEGLESFKLATK